MIDHLSIHTAQFENMRDFYSAALDSIGYLIQTEQVASWNESFPTQRMMAFGPSEKKILWLIESKDIVASPIHLAISAQSEKCVMLFYENALYHGGKDNGKPGLRPDYGEQYYAAFVFDPDGNNLEAVCRYL